MGGTVYILPIKKKILHFFLKIVYLHEGVEGREGEVDPPPPKTRETFEFLASQLYREEMDDFHATKSELEFPEKRRVAFLPSFLFFYFLGVRLFPESPLLSWICQTLKGALL
ncbi:hypothetical protein CDAR_35451 [Caerostris darwini]|uniref:Uncharacterized protein n=1 Tax=Caerostris darwini TaxID=1538125 RepID=A0AAV4SKT5_9ARAC|nr:hypothetical protein CDAR_35451 [Caerostris darwini]